MTTSPAYDLFLSYADAACGWVEGLLPNGLTAAGVRHHPEAAFALRLDFAHEQHGCAPTC